MSETSTGQPKIAMKPYRIWGHALLWFGFLWLFASKVLFEPGLLAATARFTSDGVVRKESYTYSELHDAIYVFSRQIRDDPPWIITPALLMLGGGLLLARAGAPR